jgi:glutamate carboxypeptidase
MMSAIFALMQITQADHGVLDAVDAAADDLVHRAVAWCAINSGSRHFAGLDAQRARLEAPMAALPGLLERVPLSPSTEISADGREREQAHPDALRLSVRPDAPVQVALTGHYDTVYPAETTFREVVTRADGALHGPGIADMKGGISVLLGALTAFEAHPLAPRVGYTVLLSPDEEIGSVASAPLLAALGPRAMLGLTYEPAMGAGALAAARKGSGNFHVVIRGRAAHAGRDFAAGRNAVAAAARLAVRLDALNGRRDGVTLNLARIDGGAPLNMVPDLAVARFNVRMPDEAARAWIADEIARAVAETEADGITAHLHGGFTRPPKPFTPVQQTLFHKAREVGALIGQSLTWTPSGGVCEGNNLFAAGVPNIDTLGVRGGDIHSEAEHAFPDSFAERARLSALMLVKIAEGEIDAPALKRAMSEGHVHAAV